MPVRSIIAGVLLFISLITITSGCKKTCSNVHCRSYGYNTSLGAYTTEICNNGTCYCPNGYEGDSCQTLSLNKFLNPSQSWQVFDQCSNNGNSYYVNFYSNPPYVNMFLINGLFNGGSQIEADIISNASHQGINLNIPTQSTSAGTINSGSGFYQSNSGQGKVTLTLDYTSNSTGLETTCTIIMYQQ